jgi:isocitrate dehydrogenase
LSQKTTITVAYGDGIGPEIVKATLEILDAAGAPVIPEVVEIGEKVYLAGVVTGMRDGTFETLRRNKVFLKGPINTPQGGGYQSLNVATRRALGLYANVRPCVSYHPFVETKHPTMDVVIVRENVEDTYAGIEHQQTPQVAQCLKLITWPGCVNICRYAFEYAVRNKRSKVTCFTKDNIMKMTDGMFHRAFDRVARDYPGIETSHLIIDIGTARLADTPENFDVVVTSNLYGDIISDVAAQITGSVGLAGSANVGDEYAMFEAIHGTAPDLAGQGVANPSGLLLGAVQMLVHLQMPESAEVIHNAWLRTIEEGIHTGDIYDDKVSTQKVGTEGFTAAVIERLGHLPETLKPVEYEKSPDALEVPGDVVWTPSKKLVGVDVFLHWTGEVSRLSEILANSSGDGLRLARISNRGQTMWPNSGEVAFCTDHWGVRFLSVADGVAVTHHQIVSLLQRLANAGLDFIKTEHLCYFDGRPYFSA